MLKCWSYSADDRPSFAYIVQQLETVRQRMADLNEDMDVAPGAGGQNLQCNIVACFSL